MNEHYEQWSRLSGIGMLLIGMGASIIGHAAWLKGSRRGFFGWFFVGSLGLVILNAGVAVFGDAIKHRSLYEVQLEQLTKRNT
jgi:hypothetical protein